MDNIATVVASFSIVYVFDDASIYYSLILMLFVYFLLSDDIVVFTMAAVGIPLALLWEGAASQSGSILTRKRFHPGFESECRVFEQKIFLA